ncbi:MAG: MBL fold metallo-hydrolase [Anaerolineae bacterium]|nr:MBL fold metallo-hydrolase [Anaerolineae bacterium]
MHTLETLAVPSGHIGIHWFGQNSYALKDAAGTIVLIDPYFPHHRPAETFIWAQPPLNEADLRTDFVLLTHDHSDHTCIESLRRIHVAHPQARFVGPVESATRMTGQGLPDHVVRVIGAGGTADLGTMRVHAVWSKPEEGVPADGIMPPDVQHLGYVVEVGGVRVYVTGDMINTFGDHEELLRPVADLEPEVGLLTMHPTEGEFPYFSGAVKIATRLGLKAVVPAHYACFVKRTYDPYLFAAMLPKSGPEALIIPYDSAVVYPAI